MANAPYLPEHVISHIFIRLPTKPLFRLKCLSKHWNCVISNPEFINSRSRRMIFLPGLHSNHAIDKTGSPSMVKLRFPLINPESYKKITIVGSFNGISFLVLEYCNPITIDHNYSDEHMILYNPLSGELKTIPHPPSFDLRGIYKYGYGYGTTTNDLKIVRLKNDSKQYEVFDLKTWSWSGPSELTEGNGKLGIYSGTFANGFLYWNTETKMYPRPSILALDIKNMAFSKIEYSDGCYRLGTYNGRLCMLCPQINTKGYELRVMNGHGFGESWSTLCSFISPFKLLISYASTFGKLCILDDGKLLILKSPKELIIYDMFKDSYEQVNGLTSFVRAWTLQSAEYVESLISPSDICSASI